MATVQVNVKVVVGCIAAGAVVLYAMNTVWGRGKEHIDELGAHLSGEHDHHHHDDKPMDTLASWKTRDFEDIPADLQKKMNDIKVIERNTNIEISGQKMQIFSRQTEVTGEGKKFAVLLLHGASFSSKNWEEIKTIHLIAAMGYKVVAVDLPGYGNTKSEVKGDKKAEFLAEFIKKENLAAPLIVSPSMSGSFALPYLMGSDPSICQQRATAYVPVAPVGTDQYSDADYKQCQIPVMVAYGSDDTRLGVSSKANLQQFAVNEIFPIRDAGHACYLNQPAEWHRLLYNFINAVTRYIS